MPTKTPVLHFLLLLCICLGTACNNIIDQRYTITLATIQNDTDGLLNQVRVRHQPTGAIGTTNYILPHRSFNVRFDGRAMMGDSATISWIDEQGEYYSNTLLLPKNQNNDDQEKQLVYRIRQGNQVSVVIMNPR
ncbi:hypothetical protein N9R65_04050 [Opitutales bacterium]|nr:hypothetical protein [Opitutales bacterium]